MTVKRIEHKQSLQINSQQQNNRTKILQNKDRRMTNEVRPGFFSCKNTSNQSP